MVSKFLAVLLFVSLAAPAEEAADLAVVHRIKSEAFENSKAMEHLFYLTDVYGPRLTNSPGFRAAADWAVKRLQEYGLTGVKQEKWGPFGRSWEYTRFAANMLEPKYAPLIGFPLAWTPGTSGRMTGEPVLAVLKTDADLEKFKGKLRGKIVLTLPPKDVAMVTDPLARRLTDAELAARTHTPDPSRLNFGLPVPTGPPVNREEAEKFAKKMAQFLKDEGALLILQHGYNGDGGTVFASSGGSYKSGELVPLPTVAITPEHYNRIIRLLDHKIPVKLEFEIEARFIDAPTDSFNVIGEIEGGAKKNEIVMLGAHLDSWHGGDGATDNATGSSVAIEAVRILKSLNIKMDRTVRVALWSGEEEGLLGSQAYVKEHFADQKTMVLGAEYSKLVAYYNDDGGSGKFRGISVGGNDMLKPIFEAWLAPFHDLGATTVGGLTQARTKRPGGTDHTSFTVVGLLGFSFMQDPLEYFSRTHHSNMDLYDRVQRGDLMQASAIMASFVYHTAMRKEILPRVPPPEPEKAKEGESKESGGTQ